MKKRMLSVVLTLCLMLGMVPAVYAEDTSGLQSLIDNATTAEITLNQNYVITDTVTINKDLTIHGNNHSITYSGSASAINVTATSGAAVTLENVSILAESNGAYAINLTSTQPDLTLDNVTIRADTRGVNMYPSGGCTNGKLTIESSHIYNSRISDYNTNAVLGDTRAIAMSEVKNSDITLTDSELMGFGYSINITGANGSNDINNAQGTTIDITDCTINGWSAFNIWSVNNIINITNSHLKGINPATSGWNDFATIAMNECYFNSTGMANVFTISGGSISAYSTNSYPIQSIFRIDTTAQTVFNFTVYEDEDFEEHPVDLSGNNGNTPYIFGIPAPGMTYTEIAIWFASHVTGTNNCLVSDGSMWVPTLTSSSF